MDSNFKEQTESSDSEKNNKGFLASFRDKLVKTRGSIVGRIQSLMKRRPVLDKEFLDELEAILLQADVGIETTTRLLSGLSERLKQAGRSLQEDEVLESLKEEITLLLGSPEPLTEAMEGPTVIMVVGVNGTGKTTTVGKLCHKFRTQGSEVILGATDTFRAAAIDQLEIWGKRAGARVIRHEEGADPAAVAYDACQAAKARGADYVILDTAGRLHTRVNLMKELEKIKRVVGREIPGAPHEVLLALDATSGQNGLNQAKVFKESVEVTGIALTKLDGTAKGGIVLAIRDTIGIPVKLIGIGEGIEDLRGFNPKEFANAVFQGSN
ncbi:MAG: signal recognition particle-docking protein FtsY [Firmicutes bacterium]|nr:signal recognition particle-docking protein FtsY [Bacillota bacterium]